MRIPHPWDPGYALPAYIKREGLESRAYVTKYTPRGTYDAPLVGNAGYAVPQYISDENYGQGTYVTEWAPRGWYAGDVKKHHARIKKTQRQYGLSQGPNAEAGRRGAAVIVSELARMPPAQRHPHFKKRLDQIHPTLYRQTGTIAKTLMSRGVPSGAAIELGLAQALSTTPTPTRGAQTSALGAVPTGAGAIKAGTTVPTAYSSGLPAKGECTADGAFIWNGTNWQRLAVGQSCLTVGGYGVPVRAGGGGAIVTSVGDPVQVGPFVFTVDSKRIANAGSSAFTAGAVIFKSAAELTPDQAAVVKQLLTSPLWSDIPPTAPGWRAGWIATLGLDPNMALYFQQFGEDNTTFPRGPMDNIPTDRAHLRQTDGENTGASGDRYHYGAGLTSPPIAKVRLPGADRDSAVFIDFTTVDRTSAPGPGNATLLRLSIVTPPAQSWWDSVMSVVTWPARALTGVVGGTVDNLLADACKLMASGNFASGAKTNPYIAGGEAALAASGLCKGGGVDCSNPANVANPACAVAPSSEWWIYAAAGGVVLAAYLMTKKKRA